MACEHHNEEGYNVILGKGDLLGRVGCFFEAIVLAEHGAPDRASKTHDVGRHAECSHLITVTNKEIDVTIWVKINGTCGQEADLLLDALRQVPRTAVDCTHCDDPNATAREVASRNSGLLIRGRYLGANSNQGC